jgi:hypothetical protein
VVEEKRYCLRLSGGGISCFSRHIGKERKYAETKRLTFCLKSLIYTIY